MGINTELSLQEIQAAITPDKLKTGTGLQVYAMFDPAGENRDRLEVVDNGIAKSGGKNGKKLLRNSYYLGLLDFDGIDKLIGMYKDSLASAGVRTDAEKAFLFQHTDATEKAIEDDFLYFLFDKLIWDRFHFAYMSAKAVSIGEEAEEKRIVFSLPENTFVLDRWRADVYREKYRPTDEEFRKAAESVTPLTLEEAADPACPKRLMQLFAIFPDDERSMIVPYRLPDLYEDAELPTGNILKAFNAYLDMLPKKNPAVLTRAEKLYLEEKSEYSRKVLFQIQRTRYIDSYVENLLLVWNTAAFRHATGKEAYISLADHEPVIL